MRRDSRFTLVVLLTAIAIVGCGEKEEPSSTPAVESAPEIPATTTPGEAPRRGGANAPPPEGRATGPAETAEADPRLTALERAAARTVRAFVAALDGGDAERACSLLAPGALAEIELPRGGGGCAGSLGASIGYRDPRGLPVWRGGEVARVRSIELEGETAKLVVTVVTRFADRDEVSIEDDVVYLIRDGASWLIAKPSSTLYRAVGISDVPPSVLSPP